MSDDSKRCKGSSERGACTGLIWIIGWLFTIGFVGLPFWRALLGLIIWPFFLGSALK